MKKRRKRNRFVIFCITIFVLFVAVLGKNLKGFDFLYNDTASAICIKNGVEIIGKNNPLNLEMDRRIGLEKIKQFEIEKKKKEEEEKKRQEKNKDRKVAYLTFDDGPSVKSTPIILDVLKKYDIKATFFVVGTMVKENPNILKKVYDEGHQIGNHSYSHVYSYLYKSSKNFMSDIYKTEDLIKSIVGEEFDSKIIRFPGGSFEASKAPMKKAALDSGYRYFDWNALNGDAEGIKLSEDHLLNRLKETTLGKRKVIILMHDTDQKIATAKSLEKSIKFLLDEGYEFDILDKNFSWE